MTEVVCDVQERASGPNVQVYGTFRYRPTRIVDEGGARVLPNAFTKDYNNAAFSVELAEPDGTWLWEVLFTGTETSFSMLVRPSGAGPVNLVDLPNLNLTDQTPISQAVWIETTTADFAADLAAAPVGAYLWNTDTDDVVRKDS